MFQGLREGVRRFLAVEERVVLIAPASPPPEPAPQPTAGRGLDEPSAEPLVSAGRFGLIGLQDLRETLGPRWPALQGRVRALAETIIAKHLLPGDMFETQEDGAYVLLFAGLTKDEADFKCRVIGKEITKRLLGSDSVRLADVETVSVEVPRQALKAGDLGVLDRAFAAAEPTVFSDPASPRPTAPARAEARPSPEEARPPRPVAAAALEDGKPPNPQPGPAAAQHDAARRNASPALAWRYTPVWDFKSMSLVRFRLAPTDDRTAAGAARSDDSRKAAAFEADVGALSRALDDLATLAAQGRRLFVICVIHQSSLGVEWRRDQFIELLGNAPPSVRHLLQVEVFNSLFTPSLALARFLEALAGLGVQSSVCLPLESPDAVRAGGMPLNGAAVEIASGFPQADAFSLLNTFARRSAQVNLEAAAHGLQSRSLVIGAIAAGIRFLSGEAVHGPVDDLSRGLRFEPSSLYRDLLLGAQA